MPLSREALASAAGVTLRQLERLFAEPSARNPFTALSRLAAGAGAEIAASDQSAGGGGGHRLRFYRQRLFFPRLPATIGHPPSREQDLGKAV